MALDNEHRGPQGDMAAPNWSRYSFSSPARKEEKEEFQIMELPEDFPHDLVEEPGPPARLPGAAFASTSSEDGLGVTDLGDLRSSIESHLANLTPPPMPEIPQFADGAAGDEGGYTSVQDERFVPLPDSVVIELYQSLDPTTPSNGTIEYVPDAENWKRSLQLRGAEDPGHADHVVDSGEFTSGAWNSNLYTAVLDDSGTYPLLKWGEAKKYLVPVGATQGDFLYWDTTAEAWKVAAGTDVTVVTDVQYDTSTHQLQKKTRSVTVVSAGSESSWTLITGGQAGVCDDT